MKIDINKTTINKNINQNSISIDENNNIILNEEEKEGENHIEVFYKENEIYLIISSIENNENVKISFSSLDEFNNFKGSLKIIFRSNKIDKILNSSTTITANSSSVFF